MSAQLVSTKDLYGTRVYRSRESKKHPDATRKVGKVRSCVFHPTGKRCVGFLVKRPDAALMFHRKDVFVAYNGYDEVDGVFLIHDDPTATDKGACKALGISWDDCVLWEGLAVMDDEGTTYGYVGNILFDPETGAVDSLEVSTGATSNALLGTRVIPASLIKGFKRGIGTQLAAPRAGDEGELGAILVDASAQELGVDGGLAAKAGAATAVAADKIGRAADKAKPKVAEVTAAAGEAVNKGAYATGRQISRAKGMFSDFASEYRKASGTEAEDAQPDEMDEDAPLTLQEGDTVTYVDEEGNEVVFVDEEGNEIIYTDEDGNLVEPEDYDIVIHREAPSPATQKPVESKSVGKAIGGHLRKAGGMFDAFKEEYDKARHE